MKHALICLLLSAALLFSGAFSVRAETVQLRVVETADIHVHVMDYDYFQDRPTVTAGLVRTATLIEDVRSEVENSVLVDNGDLLQGNPLGDFIARRRGLADGQVHPVYKAMNLLDYCGSQRRQSRVQLWAAVSRGKHQRRELSVYQRERVS